MNTAVKSLSCEEVEDYFALIGRKIDMSLLNSGSVRGFLAMERREKMLARRYYNRVWAHRSVQQYLSENARQCANQVVSHFFGDRKNPWERSFYLANPHGKRHADLGLVHFRTPSDFSKFLPTDGAGGDFSRCFAIERISLHPSIRNRGFLKMLAEELRIQGASLLILQHVFNPSFAFHLFQESLKTNSKILLLSGPDTVDFEANISPGPTFGWKLGAV
jgi:hypothetical protein